MNEESLFHEALARSNPPERAEFLEQACAGQPELRAAVEALLAAHEQPGEFLSPAAVAMSRWAGDGAAEPQAPATARETENAAGSTDANSRSPVPETVASDSPDDAPVLAELAPEDEFPRRIGRYVIRKLLGRGGMGAVYLAHDPELDRPIALKVPKLAGPEAEERFLREARAAAAVTHPNLCPVYDVGRADGLLYLAMAYLPGPTLTQIIRDDGPLPVVRAAAIAAAVARGMAEAHRHGIVHRDLKPGNILLDRKGEPVVTDFGLALRASVAPPAADPAATRAHDPRLTQPGILMGTPAYMPPEQARGELDRIGPVSDVYALGAILFELLTGRPPFGPTPLSEMVRQIETQPVPNPSTIRRGLSPRLDAICRKALAKEPAQRFASMEEFAAALAPFATRRRRSRWGRVGVAAAVLALLVAAAGVVFYVKTDNGTVEIRLNDPAAGVQVTVDGNEITLTENGRVTKVRAGAHALLIKGPDFETEARTFNVTRGENKIVEVELKPRPPVASGPGTGGGRPLTPGEAKLARLLQRGNVACRQGRLDDLDAIASEALKLDPESPGALALRAHYRAAKNDFDRARADADAALRLNPETARALVIRGYVSLKDGKPDETIADTTAAIRIEPTYWPAFASRAKAFFDRGEYRQAIADTSRAIEMEPTRPESYVNRGAAHACLGEYDKAVVDYAAALERGPNDPQAWLQRSALHIKMGNADKAAADFEKAKQLDPSLRLENRPPIPDPPKRPERKKLSAEETKALDRALAAFSRAWGYDGPACLKAAEEASRIDPTSAAARSATARIWLLMERFDDTITEATEALRLNPDDAWAYSARANARMGRNDPAAAIADATISLRLDPKNASTWNARAWAYLRREQYHQALADADEAIGRTPGFWQAHGNRGQCYVVLGEYQKALADFETAAKIQPTESQWRMICSIIHARLAETDKANEERQLAIKLGWPAGKPDPTLPAALPAPKKDPELPPEPPPQPSPRQTDRNRLAMLLASGRKLTDEGRIEQLETLITDALTIDAQSPGALALRSVYRLAHNDRAGARDDAEMALKLNPETFHALIVRGQLHGQDGKFDDAIADFVAALRLNPKHPVPWARLSQAYLSKKEYRQAVVDATQAIELRQRPTDALECRAAAYVNLGEYEKALKDFDVAISRRPAYAPLLLLRSGIQAKLDHADLAAADWKKAKALDPSLTDDSQPVVPDPPKPPERKKLSPEQTKELDRALEAFELAWRQGDVPGCERAAQEACRIDPTCAAARSARARILVQTKRFKEALTEANEARRLDPTDAWAYSLGGSAKATMGDLAACIADTTIALRLSPSKAQTWNSRGWCYWHRRQYHQAIADLSEAIRLQADYELPYANRASCWLHLGEYEKALADCKKGAELQPTIAKWRMMSAAIRARLGDPEGSRKDREAALRLNPNEPDAILPEPIPPVKKDPELPPDPAPDAARPTTDDRARLAGLLRRGGDLVRQNRFEDLDAVAADALKIDAESPGALALRAIVRAGRNDLDGARADADKALRLNPDTVLALFIRAHLSNGEGKCDDAIADATAALRIDPTFWQLWSKRGSAFLDRRDYHQAIADTTRALALESKDVNAHGNRAHAHACLGEYEKALADYQRALELAPNNVHLWMRRSGLYIKMGKPEPAAADWDKAKALDPSLRIESRPAFPDPPKSPERKKLTADEAKELERALTAFARAWDTGKLADCRKAADDACRLDPTSAAAHSARARILAQTEQFKDTLAEANEALRLDPNEAWAYSMRAVARTGLNDPVGGIADATISLRLNPRAETWNTRGWAYWRRGQYYQAIADFNEAIRLWPAYERPYVTRGNCRLHLGDYEKALADYAKAAELQPTVATWRMMCAVLRARLGDPDGARRDRETALKLDPQQTDIILPEPLPPVKTDPESAPEKAPNASLPQGDHDRLAQLLARGRDLFLHGRLDEFGPLAAEALRIDPESPGALALRAHDRARRNDLIGARADADAALKLNPETFHALFLRGYLNVVDEKDDDAIADLTAAMRLNATIPSLWQNRADSYVRKGEYLQAIADANRAIELGFKPPQAHQDRAAAYAHLGEYDKALADFTTAIQRAPNNPRVWFQRSALYIKMGEAAKATADWEKAHSLDPNLRLEERPAIPDPPKPPERKKLTDAEQSKLATALKAAETAWQFSKLDDCRRAAEEAVQIDPTNAACREMRARVWGAQGRLKEARQEIDEAIRLDGSLAAVYFTRGTIRQKLEDQAGAIADLTIALRLGPSVSLAWNNRGWSYRLRGQYHQAIADLTEAIRLGGWASANYSNRGECYIYLGDYEKALADFEKAAELLPTNARFRLICAALRARRGDDAGASRDRERALKIDPQQANAPEVNLPDPAPPVKKDPVVSADNP
jgi:tetratricopeptide (TPR) repeat protein